MKIVVFAYLKIEEGISSNFLSYLSMGFFLFIFIKGRNETPPYFKDEVYFLTS
ncbi:MAG: hypothetical protein ABFC34_08610 [Methanobacterium sp.]